MKRILALGLIALAGCKSVRSSASLYLENDLVSNSPKLGARVDLWRADDRQGVSDRIREERPEERLVYAGPRPSLGRPVPLDESLAKGGDERNHGSKIRREPKQGRFDTSAFRMVSNQGNATTGLPRKQE